MKYELRENQGIPVPLLALMAVATGLSVANCYYNQPLLGSMAKDFTVNDFSASMVATLTQIGYVTGLMFVIPLGDLVSRKKLILTNYIIFSCALLAIALAPNIYWVWAASLLAGASSVMPQFFIPLGVGRILACRRIFGHAAVLHPVGVLPFSTCTQGAQCGHYTILLAHRHSRLAGLQWLSG